MRKIQFVANNAKLPVTFIALWLALLATQPYGFTNNPIYPSLVFVEPYASFAFYSGCLALILELIDRLISKYYEKKIVSSIFFFLVFFIIAYLILMIIGPKIFINKYCGGTMEGCHILYR